MTLFDHANTPRLRPWLIKTLEPICDADPEVLSDYVLALLKHEASDTELRTMFISQLTDFLAKEAEPFVDKLFQTLRSKSYMPYDASVAPPPSADHGIPIPLDALLPGDVRGTKRPYDSKEDMGPRQPPKGPRLSENGNPRYGRGDDRRRGSFQPYINGPPQPKGRSGESDGPKEPCPDYHNVGFCPRGELCPFSHGKEAIVPQIPFGAPGMNFNPMQMLGMMPPGFNMPWLMGGESSGGAYDPNQAQMDVSVPPSIPVNNRGEPLKGPTDAVELTTLSRKDGPRRDNNSERPLPNGYMSPFPMNNGMPYNNGPYDGSAGPSNGHGYGRGRRDGGGPRGRGPAPRGGSFPSDAPGFREGIPNRSENKTIVVEKIPGEHLSLSGVNDWFKRFGTVTNVAIDAPTSKALVSFSNHEEAHRAWKSEEAVFGNRFVKVFWHRPLAGQGVAGKNALAASAPLVQNMTIPSSALPSTSSPSSSALPLPRPKVAPSPSALARSQLLESRVAQQKVLFSRLETASSDAEKKDLMAQLRKLNEPLPPSPPPDAPAVLPTSTVNGGSVDGSSNRPDMEVDGPSTNGTSGEGDDAEAESSRASELRAQLEALRKQAAEVGVDPNEINPDSEAPSSYAPFSRGRGRGRGRGAFFSGRGARGGARGGGPVKSMKLDNRPRKLVVRGTDVSTEVVEEWYKNGPNGGLDIEAVEGVGLGEVHVQFKSRAAAEQALARGSVPNVGSVQVGWYSAPRAPPVASPAAPATPTDTALNPDATAAATPTTTDAPSTSTSTSDLVPPTAPSLTKNTVPDGPSVETGTGDKRHDGGHEGTAVEDEGGWGAGDFDE